MIQITEVTSRESENQEKKPESSQAAEFGASSSSRTPSGTIRGSSIPAKRDDGTAGMRARKTRRDTLLKN